MKSDSTTLEEEGVEVVLGGEVVPDLVLLSGEVVMGGEVEVDSGVEVDKELLVWPGCWVLLLDCPLVLFLEE